MVFVQSHNKPCQMSLDTKETQQIQIQTFLMRIK